MKFKELPRDGDGRIVAEKVEFPVEIGLLRPVEVNGRKIESITLREPTATDIELCWKAGGEVSRMIHLAAQTAGLAPDEVRALKAIDFMRASRLLGSFL